MRGKYTQGTLLKASTARGDRKTRCRGFRATGPTLRQRWVTEAPQKRSSSDAPLCRARKALSRTPLYGVRRYTQSSTTLSAHCFSRRAHHNASTHSISPNFQEKVLLVNGISWLRFCRAEPINCLLELGQSSFVADIPLVALPPSLPMLAQ